MKMMQKWIAGIAMVFLMQSAGAQTTQTFNGWLSINGIAKMSSTFSLHFDAQLRSTDQVQYIQTIILRPGLHYHVAPNQLITLGYAFVAHHRFIGDVSGWGYEQRIWEQYILNQSFSIGGHGTSLQHRLRLEQRFNTASKVDGDQLATASHFFSQRLRYFIRGVFPFQQTKKFEKGAFFALQDEVMFNIGDASNLNGKFFDQNRAYIAFGYRLSRKYDIEAGYLNQFIAGRTINSSLNILQLACYLRL